MGIIYISESKAMGGSILKVGIANTEKDLYERFRKHQVDGYRGHLFDPFFAVSTEKYEFAEQLIKRLFSKSRIEGTELYVMNKEDMREFFELIGDKIVYPEQKGKTEEKKEKQSIAAKVKRSDLGIKYGNHLIFAYNEKYSKNFVVENIDDDVVRFEGNDYSLTRVAKMFLKDTA